MKKVQSFLIIVVLVFNTVVFANADADVRSAYNLWISKVTSAKGNGASVNELYADNAVLLATLDHVPLIMSSQRIKYFNKFTNKKDLNAKTDLLITQVITPEAAINSGTYTFSFINKKDGKTVTLPARFSFVYKKVGDKWLIINHHSSNLPAME